ncbi:MAG: nucleotide exchange factor GrpE [Patescibacteria group bacterium]
MITKSKKIKNEELNDMKNQLARALADYANLKKRSEEERVEMYKLASISFMIKILPIIDNLKQAQSHVNDSGIAIIVGQLETLAKEEGFEEIKTKVGEKFNESTDEVIEALETNKELEDNNISEVVMSGWKYSDGTIVRHARVKVYKRSLPPTVVN